jgi:molybdopterin synthase catalytic subunit
MARCVISLLIAALLLLPAIARAADTVAMRVPILVYHRFGALPPSRSVVITVDGANRRHQASLLQRSGF